MKGLIKKDLLIIARNAKVLIVMFVLFAIAAILGNDSFVYVPSMLGATIMITSFNFDEFSKWDAYAITMPNSRKNVVRAKYITTLILIGVGMIISIILVIISSLLHKSELSLLNFIMILGMGFGSLFMPIIMIPLFYKFGVERSRMTLFIIFFLLVAILGIIPTSTTDITENVIDSSIIPALVYITLAMPIILIIGLFVSYKISEIIYARKEF